MDVTNDNNPPPIIQPIAPSAVQRIVAGQAVTDLSSAVKELVDNAIDAGAGRICIKLHDQGLEAIEVSDNGSGVPHSSRPLMAAKHATSKLRQFDDLYQNNPNDHDTNDTAHATHDCAPTLGFRGEALFCLANLSRSLVVSTKCADDAVPVGEQFTFNTEGQLIPGSIKRVPRKVGTMVTVHGLFEGLPVRRVDMCKRIKGQTMKLVKMMQGYAILCLSTQFNLTEINSKNSKKKTSKSKVTIATSESSNTLEARTASILGPTFLAGLTRIEVNLSNAAPPSSPDANASKSKWKMNGLVSHSPTSPQPSNARDLQFFSVNGRPVDLPSVSRALGDAWRLFDPTTETRRRPACVLAFTLPNNAYDVNLSPDKREVMFTEEVAMLNLIKEGLTGLWSKQSEGMFAANEVENRSNSAKKATQDRASKATVKNGDEMEDTELDLTSAKVIGEGEIDNVTPKLQMRNTASAPGADKGTLITPLDLDMRLADPAHAARPVLREENINGPILAEDTVQPNEAIAIQGNDSIPQQGEIAHIHDDSAREQSSRREWDQMQLPDRARGGDRRGWEQPSLNFKRVEKKHLQHDVNDLLDDNGGKGLGTSPPGGVTEQSSPMRLPRANSEQTTSNKSSINIFNDVPVPRRQPKRQKRQTLDSFRFGAAKPTSHAQGSHSESHSENEESETSETVNVHEVADKARRPLQRENTHRANTERNTRIVVGKRIITEKRPQASLRESRREEPKASSSRAKSVPSAPLNERDNDGHNDAEPEIRRTSPPVEAVWNSFCGTQDVIAQYQNARLTMQKNRRFGRRRKSDQDTTKDTSASKEDSAIEFRKEDFLHMSIIGQFNLGFILARCHNNNLWMLDQHACDEKYNFERYCKDTVIHEQKLIAPLPLELSPSEEHCVLEHMDVFESNGFRFLFEPEKEHRHRLSLTALPHSGSGGDGKKAVQFGKDDVGALCAMLGADGTASSGGYISGFSTGVDGTRIAGVNAVRRFAGVGFSQGDAKPDDIVGPSVVRLPKAIAMFANRACRGSIMIGTALSHKEQVNILEKLDKTDVPWNCAHGRPTMSHIRSLTKCLISDDDAIAVHVAGPTLSVIDA